MLGFGDSAYLPIPAVSESLSFEIKALLDVPGCCSLTEEDGLIFLALEVMLFGSLLPSNASTLLL